MRLIDADALADASCHGGVCAECDDMYGGNNVVTNCSEVRLRFLKLIKDAPTIEERKRGRWKRRIVDSGFNADWVCSECKYRVKTDFVNYNFCPHCGAKMEGTDEAD